MPQYPECIEKEKKLLSAMQLKEGAIIADVAEILRAEDFYREEHKLIYRAILAVYARGVPPDVLMIEEELTRRNELVKVNRLYLFSLIDYEFTTTRAVAFAKEIKAKAIKRRLIDLCGNLIAKAEEDRATVDELLSEFESTLTTIENSRPTVGEELQPILRRTYDEACERRKNGGRLLGISTGLFYVDRLTCGLKKTDLIILAARPSMGKTALAMNIAIKASRTTSVLFFSLEMSAEQLGQRIIGSASDVKVSAIQNGTFDVKEHEQICEGIASLDDNRMIIDDTAGLRLSEIRIRSRRHVKKDNVGLIVIDYLQLIQGGRDYKDNRVQQVSEISRGLKALAKELDIPVLALSQLNRQVEQRADKRPQLADLRESGSIEQDADIVMFLYRDEYYNRDSEAAGTAELIIAKNRNGATGVTGLQFERELCLFRNLIMEEPQ